MSSSKGVFRSEIMRATSIFAVSAAMALAPLTPLTAATVLWVPDADGFWDVSANWNLGLPTAGDDVVISVGGAAVRTITFRTGTVTINSLASDEDFLVTGGDLIINNAYTNTQATRIQGGTLTLNGASSLVSLNQTGGTLTGSGIVTVSGTATFSSTSIRGTGQTIIQGATTLGTGGINMDEGRLLEFRGGVTTSGTSYSINLEAFNPGGGGAIRNAAGSTFVDSTSSSGSITTSFGGGSFENLGTFQKTGAGTTTINVAFTNSGAVQVDAGILRFTRSSTQSGTINVANGATLSFEGGDHSIAGSNFTGAAGSTVRMTTGNVAFTGATTLQNLQLQGGDLTLNSATSIASYSQTGGTLLGTGVVTIASAPTFSSVTMRGSGQTIMQGAVALGSSLNLDEGRLLEFRGGVTTTGTTFNFNLEPFNPGGGGAVRNAVGSTFVDGTSSSGSISTSFGGGSFENLGTYQKTGAGQTTINVAFTNSGAVQIDAGTLRFTRDGTHTGTIALANGATLAFDAGNHSLASSNLTAAAGSTLRVGGGATALTGDIGLSTLQVQGGTLTINGAATLSTLQLSGGDVAFNGATTMATLNQTGGTISGSGIVTASASPTISSVTMRGTGQTILLGATAIGSSINLDEGRVLEFRGGVTTSGTTYNFNLEPFNPGGGGIVRNAVGSTFVDSASSSGSISTSFGGGSFENLGTFQKTGAGTTTMNVAFTNSGALQVDTGILRFTRSSTQSGTVSVANGATLSFEGGDHSIASSNFTGAAGSIVRLTTGTLAFTGNTTLSTLQLQGGDLTLNSATSIASYNQSGGTLTGSGVVTIASAPTFNNVTMRGTGQSIMQGAVVIGTGSINLDEGRLLEFRGGVTTSASYNFNLEAFNPGGGGLVRNAAGSTFVDSTSSSGSISTSFGGGSFENLGTFQKTGATTTSINVAFTNSGTLDLDNGLLSLTRNATIGGTVDLANGAVLQFSSTTHSVNGASFIGSQGGIVRIFGGTVNFLTNTSVPTLQIQNGGTLSGAGTVTTNTALYDSATLTGTGTVIGNGLTTFGTSQVSITDGRVLELRGGAATGGSFGIFLDNPTGGGTLRNAVGSTFVDSTTTASNFFANSGTGLLENLGTYQKTGASTTTIGSNFTNSGTLDLDGGLLSITRNATIGGTVDLANGAVLQFSSTTHTVNGANFIGSPGGIVRIFGGRVNFLTNTSLPTLQIQNGGTLGGAGTVTTNTALYDSATLTGAGTVIGNGLTTFGASQVLITQGRVLELRGGAATGTSFAIFLDNASGGGTLRNAVGSTFVDSTSSASNFFSNNATGLLENLGTYQKTGASTTLADVAFTNSGTVRVDAGIFRMQKAVTGASGTTLTGGTWIVNGSAGGSTIDFETGTGLTSLVTNAADLRLAGANSNITSGAGNAGIEATLTTNAAAGALRIGSGRSYVATAGGGAFSNAGLLDLSGGSFGATTLSNSGTVQGFGSVTVAISNTGTVRANGGTLATRAITGSGAIQIDSGATLDASAAAADLSAGSLTHNGASLNLGTRNILINNDYQNAAFGSGNSFNARANVAGTGLINAVSATQDLSATGLTGDTLNVGNIRIGGSTQIALTITNNGTATTLRGAVQNGNAPGVSLANADFVAGPNGGSAVTTISFTSGTAGSLAGQSITVANNFDNVADATINLAGAAFNRAVGSVTPTPINFGNVRVGSTASGAVTIANTAPAGAFSEGLRVTGTGTSGDAGVSGVPTGIIAAGSSAGATVSISTAAAGARSGTVNFNLATNGTGTSGLAEEAIAGGSVAVSANVFALANAGVTPSLNFGNVRVGAIANRTVTVTNAALGGVPLGFQEGLDASIGSTPAGYSGSGSVTNLAVGGEGSLTITLDTATAGARNGQAVIALASNGTGTSGLANQALPDANVALTGAVFNRAVGSVTPTPVNLGNFRIGSTASGAVTIANTAPAGAFSEGLRVTGTGTTGDAGVSGVTASVIAAGSSGGATVSVATGTAGAKSGTVNFSFATNGTGTSGLAEEAIAGGSVTVNANVFALANAGVTSSLNFGNVRVGTTASRTVSITNTALGGVPTGFQEGLDASIGSTPAGFSGSGNVSNLGVGGNGELTINLDTTTAGARSGQAVIALASNGTGTSGLATLALPDATVDLSGAVFNRAVGSVTPTPVNLGNFRVGSTASGAVTIANTAPAGAFSEGLRVTGTGTTGDAGVSGVPAGVIAAGGSGGATVSVDTSSAGAKSGSVNFNFATNGTGTSGLAEEAIAGGSVTVNANVFALANPIISGLLQFGNVQQGSTQIRSITVENRLLAGVLAQFQEGLNANFGSVTGDVQSVAGSILNLGAGASDTSTLTVRLNTATAGAKSGSVEILLQSNGTGTSGLGNLDLPSQNVTVLGQVDTQGSVFRLAQATLDPTSVAFGSRRVGDAAPTQVLTITNSALNDGFSERLDASVGATTGRATGSGGPVSLLAAGASSTDISVSIDTSVAGANGSVTINFASNGAGTSGAGITPLASQVVTLGGAVFQAAIAGSQPAEITLASRRIGDAAATANLTISNIAPGTGGFTESLSATATGNNGFTVNGAGQATTGDLGVGGSEGLTIARGTGAAGAFTGSISIANTSLAAAGSGLSNLTLASQSVTVNSSVFQAAIAGSQPAEITLASRRVGDAAATAVLTISNVAPGTGGFTESLSATASGNNGVTVNGGGQASTGALGVGGSQGLTIARGTGTAGSFTGAVNIANTSLAIAGSGLSDLALASQAVTVNSAVYQAAIAGSQPASITLAARRVGDAAATANLTISNIAPGTGGFTESLSATAIGSNGVTVNGAGQASTGALGVGGSQALTIARGTGTAGSFTGAVNIANTSLAIAGSGLSDLTLAGQSVTVNSNVYAAAVAQLATTTVDFGTVRQGATAPVVNVGISNAAVGALADSLATSIGATPAGVTANGPGQLAAGASGEASFTLSTATAGVVSGNTSLGFTSVNPEMADLALASQQISFTGTVTQLALAQLFKAGGQGSFSGSGSAYTLDFGNLSAGSGTISADLGILNGNSGSAFAETLGGSFVLAPATGFGFNGSSFAGLIGGGSRTGNLLSFDLTGLSAGFYTTTLTFNGFSSFNGLADQSLDPVTLTVRTRITAAGVVPEPAVWAQMLFGFGLVGSLVRRRRARTGKEVECRM